MRSAAERREEADRAFRTRLWWVRVAWVLTNGWGVLLGVLCLVVAGAQSGAGTVVWMLFAVGAVVCWLVVDPPRGRGGASRSGFGGAAEEWPEWAAGCGLGRSVNVAQAIQAGVIRRALWVDVLLRKATAGQAREYIEALYAREVGDSGRDYLLAPRVVEGSQDEDGASLTVRLLEGQTWQTLGDKSPELAAAAQVPLVRVTEGEPGHALVRLVVTDVLASPRAGRPLSVGASVGPLVIGRDEFSEDLSIDLTDPWHVAVQGMTRSGKSVAVYGLLGGLARRSGVEVGGVDPTGLLLGPVRSSGRTPASRVATGTADLDGCAEVIEEYVAEMDRRIASELLPSGRDALREFDASLPLLVVVLEEYPGTLEAIDTADKALKPADRIGPRFRAAVSRLIAEGAKAGVRVVLLAQRMDASIIGGFARSNFGLRISLRVDAQGFAMLHDSAGGRALDPSRFKPGYAVVSEPAREDRLCRFDLVEYADYLAAWSPDRVTGGAHGVGLPSGPTASGAPTGLVADA